ncbi:MAG: enoyl-CoA hydratase/isomerase family protein [Flavobacteriales bacterium]|nr:enoyl-CoA hydratase/isomerase family protein [Flavobacteriales bacterium]
MSSILVSRDGALAVLTLNRPEVFNSFNLAMSALLQEELDKCATDDSIRAIVITGQGKAFCAGQDLQEVTGPENPGFERILSEGYNPIINRIRKIEKPVIAAVNGVAAGAGANIALACDVVVASEAASFIQAFSKIGLVPDSGGTFFLPRLVGWAKASAWMMLGEKVGAAEAERTGMIYRVYPAETFSAEAMQLGRQLAAMPTHGLGLTKLALNQSFHNDLAQQLRVEEQFQIAAGNTEDYEEGVKAFLEKRSPVFKGK